jgi:ribonuclease R
LKASLRPAGRPRPEATQSRLPSRKQLLSYLADNPDEASFRDLVRAFALRGRERAELREMLRELEPGGGRRPRRAREPGSLPSVAVLEVSALDAEGELLARPSGSAEGLPDPLPEIRLTAAARGPAAAVGDRVLARLSPQDDGYQGQIIRVLPRAPARLIGVVEGTARHPRLRPLGARGGQRELEPGVGDDREPGERVVAERSGGRARGRERPTVFERLGRPGEPGTI